MVQDSERLSHAAMGWLARAGEWSPVVDTAWQLEPVYEPWRLLPHGALRLLVDNGGNLEALVYGHDAQEVRLVPGRLLSSYPSSGTELVLHSAELKTDAGRVTGALLDTRVGGWHGLPPQPANQVIESRLVFLSDGAELFLVFSEPAPKLEYAWIRRGPEDAMLDRVTLRRIDNGTQATAASRQGWILEAADGAVRAELQPRDVQLPAWDGSSDYPVEGWLTVGEERQRVFGLVRDWHR
jgi:hypothetical protein